MATPYFILSSGQSNIFANGGGVPFSWAPNSRAKLWNNVRDGDTSLGTAYNALSSSFVDITTRYAHNIAAADVNKNVYAAVYARGGMDISSWFGGAIHNYPSMDAGGFALSDTPEASTLMYVSNIDAHGINRPYITATLSVGESVWLKQNSSVYRYTITTVNADANGAQIIVNYVSGSGGLVPGPVQVEFQPRFLTAIENSVPAALAAAGTSKVDLFLWWQGESDAEFNTRYTQEFEFVMSYLQQKPWWGANTKVLICGMNSTANNGLAYSDPQNAKFAALAAAAPNRYFMNTATLLPSNVWSDVFHMTSAGYAAAGDLAMSIYAPPLVDGPVDPPGTGSITAISAGTLTTVMDVSTAAEHTYVGGSQPYGLWLDGPAYPYKDGSGNTYITLPHSENYRFKIGTWSNGASWSLQGPVLMSACDVVEGHYNNRQWLQGAWSEGNTIYAMTHHEWYNQPVTIGGVPGYNGNPLFNRQWVNTIELATSTNGGATFSMSPNNNSTRAVLVPEPWSIQQAAHVYGFLHPSNIVKEGSYYYALTEQRSVINPAAGNCVCGVSMVRTASLTSPTGWEFWNGSSWVGVNHNSYQGNLSSQVPFRFFQLTNNFYVDPSIYNSHMGQSIRYHAPSGKWVMFGFAGTVGTKFAYSTTDTLASPNWSAPTQVTNPNPVDYNSPNACYISVFDEGATDLNFQTISGNTATVLVTNGGVAPAYSQIRRGTITISVSSGATATYTVTPSVSGVNEGSSITFNVSTTNVASGTVLFWTNAGTTTAADFTDGQMSGSFTISNNAGAFTRTLKNDVITEGTESIIMQIRTGSTSGPSVTTSTTVVVYDTSVPATPTYTITPTASSVNEGSSITFNVATANVADGTLYWTNSGTTTAADFTDNVNSGSVTVFGNAGSFSKTLTNDVITEGNETIVMQLRTGSTAGTVVATSSSVIVYDTSVPVVPTYSVTPSASSVNEGSSVTFTVSTTNVPNGTVLYWTNAGTSLAADFTDGQNAGSVTISGNIGSISRTVVADLTTEGNETLVLQVRAGSIAGTIVATSSTVTVVDTSVTPASAAQLWFRNVGSWLNAATCAGLWYRNNNDTWISKTLTLAGLAVRNAANTAWITFAGAVKTYAVSPSTSTINEGASVSFTITTTNVVNGTVLYWTNAGTTTAADFTDSVNSGSVTISNNTGTVTRLMSNDGQAEGNETIVLQIRTDSTSGTVVATASTVTVADTSVPATYSVSPSASSVNEGSSVTFTVSTTNLVNGTVLYWTNAGTTTAADFTDGLTSGSITISGNAGSFSRTLTNDATTEGNETIVMQLRTGSTAGPIVATASTVTVVDTSATPSYSVSPSASSVNEGTSVSFAVATTNVPNGTVLYWTNAGTSSGADFTDGLMAGSWTVTGNLVYIPRTLTNDAATEGAETIIIQIRVGSQYGTVVATSSTVTINDTSVPAVTALTMNRNNLDFMYTPVVSSTESFGYTELRVVVTTTNFFNYALGATDHLVFAVDPAGSQGNYNPHCGPILRNGANLFSTARGFIITRTGAVFSEEWNGTSSPVVTPVTNSLGTSFNFSQGTFAIRIKAGYTSSSSFNNTMTISVMQDHMYGTKVFEGSAGGFNYAWRNSTQGMLGAISDGFIGASPQNLCTEPTAPGAAYGGQIPFSDLMVIRF